MVPAVFLRRRLAGGQRIWAKAEMERVKRLWLPKVIMSSEEEFEKNWKEYMADYEQNVDVEAYVGQLNREIRKRVEAAEQQNR